MFDTIIPRQHMQRLQNIDTHIFCYTCS